MLRAVVDTKFLAYMGLGKESADHQTVSHGTGEYVRDNVYTNSAQGISAYLRES
jgi:hypothetical protein